MNTKTETLYNKLISLLFIGMLFGLTLINVFWPFQEFSTSENRFLAKMPVFSWNSLLEGHFTTDFETFLTDQFPLREVWVSVKSNAERFMQKKENNGVYFAKGRTLIERFDAPNVHQSMKNLQSIQEFMERTTLPVHVGWIPTAAEIQKENLPTFASPYSQSDYIETLLQTEPSHAAFLSTELWQGLQSHSEEPLYFATDHHWTMLGAFRFYETLMSYFGVEALDIADFQREIVSENFYGTLDAKTGGDYARADQIERWDVMGDSTPPLFEVSIPDSQHEGTSFYFPHRLEEKDQYTYYLDGNHAVTILRNLNLPQGRRLLLIKDSFAHALAPFLVNHFSEVHMLDLRYYNKEVDDYLVDHKIDEVLVLYSTRQFATDPHLFKLGN